MPEKLGPEIDESISFKKTNKSDFGDKIKDFAKEQTLFTPQKKILDEFIDDLSKGYIWHLDIQLRRYEYLRRFLNTEKVRNAAEKGMQKMIMKNKKDNSQNWPGLREFIENFDFLELQEHDKQILEEEIVKGLRSESLFPSMSSLSNYHIIKEKLRLTFSGQNTKTNELVKDCLERRKGDLTSTLSLIELFGTDTKVVEPKHIEDAIKYYLDAFSISGLIELKDTIIRLGINFDFKSTVRENINTGLDNHIKRFCNAYLANSSLDNGYKELVSSIRKFELSFGFIPNKEEVFAENIAQNLQSTSAKEDIVQIIQKLPKDLFFLDQEKYFETLKVNKECILLGIKNRLIGTGTTDYYLEMERAKKMINAKEMFGLSVQEITNTLVEGLHTGLINSLKNNQNENIIKIFNIVSDEKLNFEKFIDSIPEDFDASIFVNNIPYDIMVKMEKRFYLLSYSKDLNIPSAKIYAKYKDLFKANDTIRLKDFCTVIKDKIQSVMESGTISEDLRKYEYYKDIIEVVYPNNSSQSTDYENNESCLDRTEDLAQFRIKDKYIIDTQEGVEMKFKEEESENEKSMCDIERPIKKVHDEFFRVGFDLEKMRQILDERLDKLLANNINKEILGNREEKIFALILELLTGKIDIEALKESLIAYQFQEFEDIRGYFEGTRAQSEKSKNPRYAYLLELRDFFADKLKDIEHHVVDLATRNPKLMEILPEYYQRIIEIQQQQSTKHELDKVKVGKIGLEGNLLDRILKSLEQRSKKGKELKLYTQDENGEIILGEKGKAIAGMIKSEQGKAAQIIKTVTGEDIKPEDLFLGELNLEEYLALKQKGVKGEYDKELFERYLQQAFQEIFSKEIILIDQELAKYKPVEELEGRRKLKKLEAFITKNKTSAHARQVAGVCVSGDNPLKAQGNGRKLEECQWNMENYFQMVFRDPEKLDCKGLCLLHYHTDQGKKILTVSFNPSSTYLYTIDEQRLFRGILESLVDFAQDNEFDIIAVSKNKSMRTNRTGGEFERAIDRQISSIKESFTLSEEKTFSYSPRYIQKDLDIIWKK